jgi:isocitrate dehydrogenase kinase/phosphatase
MWEDCLGGEPLTAENCKEGLAVRAAIDMFAEVNQQLLIAAGCRGIVTSVFTYNLDDAKVRIEWGNAHKKSWKHTHFDNIVLDKH